MKKTVAIKARFKAPKSKKYDKKELKKGMNVEKEHSKNKKVQKVIAKNHLDERKDYYKRLKKIERKK